MLTLCSFKFLTPTSTELSVLLLLILLLSLILSRVLTSHSGMISLLPSVKIKEKENQSIFHFGSPPIKIVLLQISIVTFPVSSLSP